jgi:hypothetical protein
MKRRNPCRRVDSAVIADAVVHDYLAKVVRGGRRIASVVLSSGLYGIIPAPCNGKVRRALPKSRNQSANHQISTRFIQVSRPGAFRGDQVRR